MEQNKLAKLQSDLGIAAKIENFNQILNHTPKIEWVKNHPFAPNVKYIPIEIIENLLRQIFTRFEVKVNSFQIITNSIAVHVTLKVKDVVTGEWWSQDGLGAVALQLDKDANATDFTKIKSNSVMLGLPAAESYAIKDAAEKFGAIFGANLNRKDIVSLTDVYSASDLITDEEMFYLLESLDNAKLDDNKHKSLTMKIRGGINRIEADKIKREYLTPMDSISMGGNYGQGEIIKKLNTLK